MLLTFPQWITVVLLSSLCFVHVNGDTVFYDLIFTRETVAPDGFRRSAFVINGQLIGPTIKAYVGDTVIVNVTNMAFEQEALTIHWHGVTGIASAWHDGAQSVTNCPIPRGTSYQQTFTALSEGTHFYHSHTGNTRADGTYGVIAFSNREPTLTYDNEFSLILSDWYHKSVLDLTAGLEENPFQWMYNGDSILMNGKGLCRECSNDTRSTDTTTQVTYEDGTESNTTSCQGNRERFLVEPGKTYLIRLVNAAAMGYYNFAVAGHSLTIVGTGSSATVQTVVNSVEIAAGQRLEVLITCNQHALDPAFPEDTYSFSMQAQSDYRGPDTSFAGIGNGYFTYFNPVTSPSELNYEAVSAVNAIHDVYAWDAWNPLLRQDAAHADFRSPPQSASTSHVLVTQQEWVNTVTGKGFHPALHKPIEGDASMSLAWTLNGQRLNLPNTPLLLTSYLTQKPVIDPSVIRFNIGDVVDITVQNSVAGNGVCETHPWHVHSTPGWIVGEGNGSFDRVNDPSNYNLVDPPYIDTVTNFPSKYGAQRNGSMEKGEWQTPCGWFTMRLKISDPGMWFFHCHIDWHVSMGMAVVFDVESERVEGYPEDMPLCGEAIASDTYRREQDASSDNGEKFTAEEVAGVAIGTFLFTLTIASGSFYYVMNTAARDDDQVGSEMITVSSSDDDRYGSEVVASPIKNESISHL